MERIVFLFFLLKAMKCNAQRNKQFVIRSPAKMHPVRGVFLGAWGKELIAKANAPKESESIFR